MTAIEKRRCRVWGRARAVLTSFALAGGVVVGTSAVSPNVAEAAPGDPILYGVNGFGTADVLELDIVAQTATGVGDLARESSAVDLDPATGRLYFYEWRSSGDEFGYFDPASGTSTIVRSYSPRPGHSMTRMAFAPSGLLYAMNDDDALFTIDPVTGDLSELGTVSGLDGDLTTGTGDMSFAADGTLYVAVDRNLYTVDIGSLSSSLQYSGMIPVTGVGFTVWTGLAHCDGVMYASSVEQTTSRAGIFSIDPATGDEELLYYSPTRLNDLASCAPVVTPVNTAPVAADGSIGTVGATAVDVTLAASDAEGDALAFVVSTGPSNGSLTGTAPNLTYTPNAGFSGTDSFTFVANDGQVDSNVATVTITVDPAPNAAPVAEDGDFVTPPATSVAVPLSASDADGDALTFAVSSGPSNGSLTGTAPNLTYTPNAGFSGTDSFTFVANDGVVDSNVATVTITVDPAPNAAPTADDGAATTPAGQAVGVTLSGSDADGDALSFSVVAGPSGGTLSGAAPNLTYTPNGGFSGADSFTFVANDGVVDSNVATVTITVDPPPNTAPVADDGSVTTSADEAVGVTLSGSDAEGDALTFVVSSGPSNGVLAGSAPNLTYTPDVGFVGTDSFTFVANDGQVDSNTATVTITVDAPAPTAPGSPTDLIALAADRAVSLSWQAPVDDGGSPITDYQIEFRTRGAAWQIHPDGVSSSPTAMVTGLTNYDEYRFRLVAINAAGAGPGRSGDWVTPTDGDDPDETFNHPDGNLGDQVGWSIVDPTVLSDLLVRDGHVIGTGDPDGTASVLTAPVGPDVEVTVDALLGDSYNEASVVLRMPTRDDYDQSYLLQWVTDGEYVSAGTVTGPAIQIWRLDPNRIVLLADAQLADNGERTLTFGAQGSNIYIAEDDEVLLSVTDDTYLVGDFFALGQGNLSGGGTPTQLDNLRYEILQPPANAAPVALDGAVDTQQDTQTGVTLSASDADGDVLTFVVSSGPSSGTLSGSAPNLTYTPDPGFSGTDSFTFVVNDGLVDSNTATVTITVDSPSNTAPTAQDGEVTTVVAEAVDVTLSASDADGDALGFVVSSGPSNGVLTGSAPDLTYTPNPGFSGGDSFAFVANDGEFDSNTAVVTITVEEPPPVLTTWGGDRAGRLREIDLVDGSSTSASGLSFGTQAMDRDPVTGDIYYYEWNSNGNEFAVWDADTGTNTSIRTYDPAPGLFVVQMAFAPDGTLYVIDMVGVLHTLDTVTGDITTLGSISGLTNGPYGQAGDLAFAPDGSAYIGTYGALYRLDVPTRTATLLHDDMFDGAGFIWLGLAHCDGRLFGAHVDGANRSAIYEIDEASGDITLVHYMPTYVADLTGCATG